MGFHTTAGCSETSFGGLSLFPSTAKSTWKMTKLLLCECHLSSSSLIAPEYRYLHLDIFC